jgi:hypothetical protein
MPSLLSRVSSECDEGLTFLTFIQIWAFAPLCVRQGLSAYEMCLRILTFTDTYAQPEG